MKIAVIAGSGLSPIVERISGERRPWRPRGVLRPAAPGQVMEVVEGTLGGVGALAFAGRLHHYQGYSMAEVAAPVRFAHEQGADTLFVTNAAGALHPGIAPGALVLIRDHISLLPESPLRGEAAFVDMSDAYDSRLRQTALAVARDVGIDLAEGVYAAVAGPHFETPAEVRMLRTLGADVVGMSTVPEVIVARALEMRVLAVSVATNAAGTKEAEPGTILRVAAAAAERLGLLLEEVAKRLGSGGER